MTTRLSPYLAFQGQARDAMEFYAAVFGGTLNAMTFGEMGGMGLPEDQHAQIMHSDLDVNDGFLLMGSDQPGPPPTNGSVSISGDDDTTLRAWFAGLSEGGEVAMPLEVAPWGDAFGQLTDRFGIAWMFNIAGTPAA